MPHFFFDVHNDVDIVDTVGRDYPDLAAARQAAIQDIRLMVGEQVIKTGSFDLQHFITICDEEHRYLRSVPFREAVRGRV